MAPSRSSTRSPAARSASTTGNAPSTAPSGRRRTSRGAAAKRRVDSDRATDFAAGIGNFGLANTPKPVLPPGYPTKPYNQAPPGYHAAARAHGMVPCLECKLLPAVEPNHECYDCGKNLHAWCGTGLFGSKQRCHDCCWKLGVPDDAENPQAIKIAAQLKAGNSKPPSTPPPAPKPSTPTPPTTTPTTTRTPLATTTNRGPNRVGIDPGGKKPSSKRRKKSDRPANEGIITTLDVTPTVAPKLQAKPIKKQYQGHFIEFMEFWQKREYADDQEFDPETLRAIRPHDVVMWMHHKAYGKTNVNYQTYADKPKYARHSHLLKAKSAISYYMPDPEPWNDKHQCGNPTRSPRVNSVLKRINEMEAKDLGAPSKEKRDMRDEEFRFMTRILSGMRHIFFNCQLCVAYAVLAFNLIFRSDCVSWLKVRDVKKHPQYDFALSLTVKWGKTVRGNKKCPPQIVIGSMDTWYCPLLNLAVFLETWLKQGGGAPGFNDSYLFTKDQERDVDGTPLGPKRVNRRFQKACTKIFKGDDRFKELAKEMDGDLGSHSIRKFAATFCKNLGIDLSDVNFRGRWKSEEERNNKVLADSYVNKNQPIIDAQVAEVLCQNQPCSYRRHKDATGVTDQWLLKHVVPFMHHFYSQGAGSTSPALTLAYPLLWAAMSPEMEHRMDPLQRNKIREEYEKIRTLPVGVNPVVRVGLRIGRRKHLLVIDEVSPEVTAVPADSEAAAAATAQGVVPLTGLATPGADTKVILDTMFSYQQQLVKMVQNNNQSSQNMISGLRSDMDKKLDNLNHHVCRLVVALCLLTVDAMPDSAANTPFLLVLAESMFSLPTVPLQLRGRRLWLSRGSPRGMWLEEPEPSSLLSPLTTGHSS